MKKINPRVVAIILFFITSAIWGATFVTQRIAGEHMGAFTYNGVRFLMGSLSLLPVIAVLERREKKPGDSPQSPGTVPCRRAGVGNSPEGRGTVPSKLTWFAGAVAGLMVFVAANLQQFGIVLSDSPSAASEAGFITGMYIIFVPILGLLLFRRKARPVVWVSAVLAFGGLFLITTEGGVGYLQFTHLLVLICAVFWAAHILWIDRYVSHIRPITFVAVQFLVCGALSLGVAFIFETVTWQGIYGGMWVLLYGGIIASGIAYTLQAVGQKYVEPALAAIIFSMEALFAAVSEAVFLGETMTGQKYLGGAVIFVGILLAQYKKKTPHQVRGDK